MSVLDKSSVNWLTLANLYIDRVHEGLSNARVKQLRAGGPVYTIDQMDRALREAQRQITNVRRIDDGRGTLPP